jgi:hypothetical protein
MVVLCSLPCHIGGLVLCVSSVDFTIRLSACTYISFVLIKRQSSYLLLHKKVYTYALQATLCNTPSTPGLAVLTPDSPLGSYIIPTDQHKSFVHILFSLVHT